jgi:ATP-binding cassette subfamily B (MDR/TAP) protein 1
LFYLVLGNLIDALTPGIGKWRLTPNQLQEAVSQQAIYLALIAIGSGLFQGFMQFANGMCADQIGNRIKSQYFRSVTKQEIGYFDLKKTGAFLNNMSEDVVLIEQVYSERISGFFQYFAQVCMGLGLAFSASWRMTLIMLACAPVIMVIFGVSGQLVMFMGKTLERASSDCTSVATEIIQAMKTVRSMSGEDKEIARYNTALQKVNLYSIVKGISGGVSGGLGFFGIWGTCSLAFYYGGWLIYWGLLSIGGLIQVFGNMLFVVIGLGLGIANIPPMIKSIAIHRMLLEVILRKPMIKNSGGDKIEGGIKGDIEIKHVGFTYPSRPKDRIMEDFSISIKAGQTVALVGKTGSGKSTTVGLLERFYEYDKGEITIDGYDLRKLDPEWLHYQIGYVSQEPTLFATSIRENILYGVPDPSTITDDQIEAAAMAANAHNFIMGFEKGYQTTVGERGSTLSGGQKQRVAIARAMLQNPKVLLLDEATSALDTESEALVQEALEKLMQGRTSIVIAHRLATILNADNIFMIDHGNVIESGTHAELVEKKGAYYKLVSIQMKLGEEKSEKTSTQEPGHIQVALDGSNNDFELHALVHEDTKSPPTSSLVHHDVPVQEQVAPVVDSQEEVKPVVDQHAPVVEHVAPVVEEVAPVVPEETKPEHTVEAPRTENPLDGQHDYKENKDI